MLAAILADSSRYKDSRPVPPVTPLGLAYDVIPKMSIGHMLPPADDHAKAREAACGVLGPGART